MRESILKAIADAVDDVEAYIKIVENDSQNTGRQISNTEICEIAKRLIKDFRGLEVIQWLEKIKINHNKKVWNFDFHAGLVSFEKNNLLIEAYQLEGNTGKVKEILWYCFEQSLGINYYLNYIKYTTEEEKQVAFKKVLQLCRSFEDFSSAIKFLFNLQAFAELDVLILERVEQIDARDYSLLREVSTVLASHEKYLTATLLRRALVSDVLDQGVSKYYHYGVSDLKKAIDFAKHIEDWKGHIVTDDFMDSIYKQHFRKVSFWS